VGDTEDVSPHFFRRGDIICHDPPHFSLSVFTGAVTKLNVTVVTFRVEFFMSNVTHSHVGVEIEFGVVSLTLIFL